MKFICIFLMFVATAAHARELDFLQTDPRFTGGEFNAADSAHPNFWFYDQYAPARKALQADGINLIAVKTLSLVEMTADSDALYIPAATDAAAKTYPLTDDEIDAIRRYVAGGRSIIFNLGEGRSAAMDNDLFKRLGISAKQAADDVSGYTFYPLPGHPIFAGPLGAVGGFALQKQGYLSEAGGMRCLITVDDKPVLPFVEKGDLSDKSGAYIFILDSSLLSRWNEQSAACRTFFLNLVNYAVQDQYLHYKPSR